MNERHHKATPLTIAAVSAVRECADTMERQSESLRRALSDLPMDAGLRGRALESSAALKDTSSRVMFELALLQSEIDEGKVDTAVSLRRLSVLDAAMMEVVAGATELVDRLEQAAERDEQYEPAFVIVIEAVGLLMRELERARAATAALAQAVG